MQNALRATLRCLASSLLACALLCGTALAQQPSLAALNSGSIEVSPTIITPMPQVEDQHKFWDKKNCILFAAVAGASAADFAVTRANLNSGGQEFNPITRLFGHSTAGLALNFSGQTVGVVGLSYLFHKTRHHRLERAVSFVTIGSSSAAISFDLAHR